MIENHYYKIMADTSKNRLYLTLHGFWSTRKKDEFGNYVTDLVTECSKFNNNKFHALVDLRDFSTPPVEIGEMHVEAQKKLLEMGLKGSAEIYETFTIAQLATKRYAKQSNMKQKAFTNIEEAEEWLNSL